MHTLLKFIFSSRSFTFKDRTISLKLNALTRSSVYAHEKVRVKLIGVIKREKTW
jgi:hypothetical protein